MGHGYNGPKQAIRARELNPGTTKRPCCKGRGLNPVPTERSCCKARGSNPGPTKKIIRAIMHAIANTIAYTIIKINMRTKACADARTSSKWNMSNGLRTTARLTKNGQQTDRFKNDAAAEKDMLLAEHIFLRYHIRYQFM